MNLTPYENTYVCIRPVESALAYVNEVAAFLRENPDRQFTPAEIGEAVIPNYRRKEINKYSNKLEVVWEHRGDSAHLGQILKHLFEGGFVGRKLIDGEPIETTHRDWVEVDADNEPRYITVHDDEGRSYEINNPRFKYYDRYIPVEKKETITPKIKVYFWRG